MKVSAIITVYNLERFVEEAIRSAINQTQKPEEIIVVNDGSSDKSDEIIRRYSNDINYINKKSNEGVLPAIISAIKQSSGDILMFLDGDDVWKKNKVKKVSSIFKQYDDVMLVTHNYQWINADSNPQNKIDVTHRNLKHIGGSNFTDYKKKSELLKDSILTYKGVWLGSAFAIRRDLLDISAFEKILTDINRSYLSKSHQDQPLAAYLIGLHPTKHIYFIDDILFEYRVFGANSSGNTSDYRAAMATIDRSYATVYFTRNIIKRLMEGRVLELRVQDARLVYFEYLRDLYNGYKVSALLKFYKAMPALSAREFFKEISRYLIIIVVGPTTFFKIK